MCFTSTNRRTTQEFCITINEHPKSLILIMSSYSFVLEKFLCLLLSFLVGGLPHQTKKRGATQEFCITMTAAQKLGISMLVLFEISGGINCLFTKAWPPIEESVWPILHPSSAFSYISAFALCTFNFCHSLLLSPGIGELGRLFYTFLCSYKFNFAIWL